MSHLVQEVELRHVGDLCVEQLIGDVEDPLLDRQLDRETANVTHDKSFTPSETLELPPGSCMHPPSLQTHIIDVVRTVV